MRHFLQQILNISALVAITSAQLIIPQVVLDQTPGLVEHQQQQQQQQKQVMAEDDIPPRSPMLSDQLSLEPQASIFFTYARESAKASGILEGGEYNGVEQFTVFVPTNKAIMALARKPHKGREPVEGSIEISNEEADRESQENVERWVSAHMVPESLDPLSAGDYPTLLDGKSLQLTCGKSHKSHEWQDCKLNAGIAIIGQRKASNGVMYLIEGTIEV